MSALAIMYSIALAIAIATLLLYARFAPCPGLQTHPRRSRWRLSLR